MPASLVDGNSLLAVDIGAVTTRAAYFDVVEGQYRLIGMGQCPTTNDGGVRNLVLGVQLAVENLQNLLGKQFMDEEGRLLIPSQPDGAGVDGMVATLSAGAPIKTLLVGLLPEVSLKSIEKLVHASYARVLDTISLNDSRRLDEQVNAVIRQSPELILIAGGVDGGATHSINSIIETIGLAAYLMPDGQRPAMLYAGNRALAGGIRATLGKIASELVICPNVRPSLDVEDLAPAQRELAKLTINIRQRQMPEIEELRVLTGGVVLPTAYAQGRMTRFLSVDGENKHILSVDVGASAVSMAAAFGESLYLNVFPQFGLGEPLAGLLKYTTLDEVARWLPVEMPLESVRDFLYQKSLYPQHLPATHEELFLEQAIARQNLLLAAQAMTQRLPGRYRRTGSLFPNFELILASGSVLTNAPTLGQKLLLLLDALQPAGITTLAIDQNNLLPMLGAAAEVNSLLPVQVIASGALAYLATVISPVSNSAYGTPIVRAKLIREDGTTLTSEVNMGNLQILPLENGQTARLELRPLRNADVGLGPGRAGALDVIGSSLGVVIDARGRPLRLPSDAGGRVKLLKKWLKTVGG
ncbi:MAG: glutamate mutase L [Anaerolineales bacterium]|nr:glutamate mutase L [Anaerolineales bacterium]MDW8278995.1 glutamate mutase L [Anaerolineales bacterium]